MGRINDDTTLTYYQHTSCVYGYCVAEVAIVM